MTTTNKNIPDVFGLTTYPGMIFQVRNVMNFGSETRVALDLIDKNYNIVTRDYACVLAEELFHNLINLRIENHTILIDEHASLRESLSGNPAS